MNRRRNEMVHEEKMGLPKDDIAKWNRITTEHIIEMNKIILEMNMSIINKMYETYIVETGLKDLRGDTRGLYPDPQDIT
jgi:hypothetical protein